MFLKAGAFSIASEHNDFFSVSQARYAAVPKVEVVVDPPCVGPGGSSESPSLNEIRVHDTIYYCVSFHINNNMTRQDLQRKRKRWPKQK